MTGGFARTNPEVEEVGTDEVVDGAVVRAFLKRRGRFGIERLRVDASAEEHDAQQSKKDDQFGSKSRGVLAILLHLTFLQMCCLHLRNRFPSKYERIIRRQCVRNRVKKQAKVCHFAKLSL